MASAESESSWSWARHKNTPGLELASTNQDKQHGQNCRPADQSERSLRNIHPADRERREKIERAQSERCLASAGARLLTFFLLFFSREKKNQKSGRVFSCSSSTFFHFFVSYQFSYSPHFSTLNFVLPAGHGWFHAKHIPSCVIRSHGLLLQARNHTPGSHTRATLRPIDFFLEPSVGMWPEQKKGTEEQAEPAGALGMVLSRQHST